MDLTDLDHALARFCLTEFEYSGGLSNHGPMVAEALHALGHAALIDAWLDLYFPRLRIREEGQPIPLQMREQAFGRSSAEDWASTFESLAAHSSWRALLRDWLPRLLPGFFAAAGHGPIRVGHAIRALEEAETPPRLQEFCLALGYWASRFLSLPGAPDVDSDRSRGPAEVLKTLEFIPLGRRGQGLLVDAAEILKGESGFASSLNRLDLWSSPLDIYLSEICATAAGLYLANPHARVAYAHAITAPAALRLFAPHLEEEEFRRGIFFALQTVSALHATHGSIRPAPLAEHESPAAWKSWDEMRYLAACSLEEHVIKLTEACWREDRIRPDPRFRLAAGDAIRNLGRSQRRG